MLSSLTLFIGITLMYSTPLVFAALGGVVSERSGVTNIGIEGMMTIGAVTGATVGYYSGSAWAGFFAAHRAASCVCGHHLQGGPDDIRYCHQLNRTGRRPVRLPPVI